MNNNYIVLYDLKTTLESKREKLGLSVRELGKKAGVSYTVIYDFEKRGVVPKIETLFKLAESLGLNLTISMEEDKIPTKKQEFSSQELIEINLFNLGLGSESTETIMEFIEFELSKIRRNASHE